MLSTILKNLRKEKNISQKELATILNISASTIGMYEQGRRTPDAELLKKIADYFNVSVDYLLERTDERNPKEDLGIVTKAFHLAEDVDELPQEALDQIDEYIRLLKLKHKK